MDICVCMILQSAGYAGEFREFPFTCGLEYHDLLSACVVACYAHVRCLSCQRKVKDNVFIAGYIGESVIRRCCFSMSVFLTM